MKADEEKTPEELEAEIAETREDLGDTVAAVADKADVKKQAKKKTKEKVEEVKAQAAEIKETVSAKANEAKDTAAAKVGGSDSTGDIGQNPEMVGAGGGLADNPLVLVVAAFVVGLAIGRWTAR